MLKQYFFIFFFYTSLDIASPSHSLPRMKYIWTGHMCAVAAYGVCGTELWTLLLNTLRCNSKVLVWAHSNRTSSSKHLLHCFLVLALIWKLWFLTWNNIFFSILTFTFKAALFSSFGCKVINLTIAIPIVFKECLALFTSLLWVLTINATVTPILLSACLMSKKIIIIKNI